MDQERTDGLIGEISRDLTPVRPIPQLRQVVLAAGFLWLVTAAAIITMGGVTLPQLQTVLGNRAVDGLLLGLVLVSLGGLLAALAHSVPGREGLSRWGLGLVGLGLFSMAGLGVGLLLSSDSLLKVSFVDHAKCLIVAVVAGAPPVVAVALFVARGFPQRPLLVGLTAAAGVVAMGGITAQIACPMLAARHLALGHAAAPWIGMVLLALPLMRAARRTRRAGGASGSRV